MLEKALLELMKQAVREVLAEGQAVSAPVATEKKPVGRPRKEATSATTAQPDATTTAPTTTAAATNASATSQPAAPAKASEPAATTSSQGVATVSVDELRAKCAEVAKKLGSPDRVQTVIAAYGGKVANIPEAQRLEVSEALDALLETATDDWG